MTRTSRWFMAAAIATTSLALSLPAQAFPGGPSGSGGPGNHGGPPPGGGGGGGTISALSVAKLSGSFTLTKASSTAVNAFVTNSKYTATGVTITITSDTTVTPTTLTGDVTITTTTTADASGNGVVHGDLTFVAGTNSGITAHIDGLVGTAAGPLLVAGDLHVPSTTTTSSSSTHTPPSQVAAYLSADSSLAATLTGYVATATTTSSTSTK